MFELVEVINTEGGMVWNPYKGSVFPTADAAFSALKAAKEDTSYTSKSFDELAPLTQWYRNAQSDVVVYNIEIS